MIFQICFTAKHSFSKQTAYRSIIKINFFIPWFYFRATRKRNLSLQPSQIHNWITGPHYLVDYQREKCECKKKMQTIWLPHGFIDTFKFQGDAKKMSEEEVCVCKSCGYALPKKEAPNKWKWRKWTVWIGKLRVLSFFDVTGVCIRCFRQDVQKVTGGPLNALTLSQGRIKSSNMKC